MTIIILLCLLLSALPSSAQDVGRNYVKSQRYLDADGARRVTTVQYFDGLGRPSQQCTDGMGTTGRYVHTAVCYDRSGRDSVVWLPAVGGTSPSYLDDTPSLSSTTYSDDGAFSVSSYDPLDRVLHASTPGEAWHSAGKGKTTTYITNGEDDVKYYVTSSLTSATFSLQGYYPANTLRGETSTDEDGHTVTVFTDHNGNKVLERHPNGKDTYYVYSASGLLRFVLMPSYQQTQNMDYVYVYKYDTMNRCTEKTIPGSAPVTYAYDLGDRCVITQDGLLREKGRYRFTLCDAHGRETVRGTCSAYALNQEKNVRTQFSPSTQGICGTGYTLADASALTLTDARLEAATYYDRHTFLTHPAFTGSGSISTLTDSQPAGTGQTTFAVGYKTGEIIATSDGGRIYTAYYYDQDGLCIDQRRAMPQGRSVKTVTSYTFTDNPLTVTKTYRTGSGNSAAHTVTTTYTYDPHSDKLLTTTVTFGDDGTEHVVSSLTYDDLGRVTSDSRDEIGDAITYAYDLHGWPTRIENGRFTERLNYATGPGTARYNGDISSQLWQAADSVLRGYKFTYNTDDMLAYAYYGEGSDIDTNTGRYNEHSPAYTPDNAITRIRRNAKRNDGTYGMVDNLYYSYDGVHPTNIRDASTSALSYTGAYEYKNLHGDTSTPDFTYNTAGLLTSDLDKGITRITYNDIGLTDSIRFSDNTVIRYVYSMTGEKLRVTRSMDITHTAPIIDDPIPFDPLTAGTQADGYVGGSTSITDALILDDTEYLDADFTVTQPDGTYTYYFGSGYIKQDGLQYAVSPGQTPVQSPQYFYYTKDHLGNIRSVVTKNPSTNAVTEVQRTHYYPYGGIIADISTGQNTQPRLYNGKELDRTNNLWWYDFVARPYDPTRGQFTGPDQKAEEYYPWNQYAFCGNNPMNRIDPNGKDWFQSSDGKAILWQDSYEKTITINDQVYNNIGIFYTVNYDWGQISYQQDKIANITFNDTFENLSMCNSENMFDSFISKGSAISGTIGVVAENIPYTYRLTNSKGSWDFHLYKTGWNSNQYVKTERVSNIGKLIKKAGTIGGALSLGTSVCSFISSSNPVDYYENGMDVFMDIIGFMPGSQPVLLFYSFGGKSLARNNAKRLIGLGIDGYPSVLPTKY